MLHALKRSRNWRVSIQRRAGYRNYSDAEGERQENNTKLKPYPLLDHEESEHIDHLKSQNHFEPDLVLCRSRFPKRKIFRELENSEHNVPTTHSMNPQYSTIGSTRVVDEMERWRSLRSTPFCKMESKSAPTDPKRTTDEPTSTPTDPKRASDEPTSTPLKESVGNEVIPTEVPIPKDPAEHVPRAPPEESHPDIPEYMPRPYSSAASVGWC